MEGDDYSEPKDSGDMGMLSDMVRLLVERVTTPAPARLVFMEETISQLSVLGLYISAE